jgi:hypothetical protein
MPSILSLPIETGASARRLTAPTTRRISVVVELALGTRPDPRLAPVVDAARHVERAAHRRALPGTITSALGASSLPTIDMPASSLSPLRRGRAGCGVSAARAARREHSSERSDRDRIRASLLPARARRSATHVATCASPGTPADRAGTARARSRVRQVEIAQDPEIAAREVEVRIQRERLLVALARLREAGRSGVDDPELVERDRVPRFCASAASGSPRRCARSFVSR